MSKINYQLRRGTPNDLERVIEPLASYICATDQPKAAMKSALVALFRTVAETNRVASSCIGHFSEVR